MGHLSREKQDDGYWAPPRITTKRCGARRMATKPGAMTATLSKAGVTVIDSQGVASLALLPILLLYYARLVYNTSKALNWNGIGWSILFQLVGLLQL